MLRIRAVGSNDRIGLWLTTDPNPRNAGKTSRVNFHGSPVLVVDDDVLVLELLAHILAELGCDTLTARSATEALEPSRTTSIVFREACKLGCGGIVSKRLGSMYRQGRSPHWMKVKNPNAPAVKREAEEDWGVN
jgi:hypothetical protein